jgi:hypothetical protein
LTDTLQTLLGLNEKLNVFPQSSRYHGIETTSLRAPDERVIVYMKRRFVPDPKRFVLLQEHTVVQGDRPDILAAKYVGDSEQFWRLCDANGVLDPNELTASIGRKIRITMPEGITGINYV